jgi:hypothetical protein
MAGIVVEHNDNDQLLAYLLGKALEAEVRHDQRYAVTVVQPNAPHEEGRTRTVETTADELKAFQQRYRAAYQALRSGGRRIRSCCTE